MSSPWGRYINRTAKVLTENTSKVLRMDGMHASTVPKTLFTFRSKEDLAQYVTGCDADIGGTSSCTLDLGPDGKGRFWGDMRLDVKPGMEKKIKGGYAGFRNRSRPTLFGNITDDISLHKYLALRVRAGGDPRTHTGYFVNLQTDGPVQSDLWQHRLYLRGNGTWEDVLIPIDSFVLTNSGETVSHQIQMMSQRIRTIGVSLLGGKANIRGRYELGIDSIKAVNSLKELTETEEPES